MFMSFASVIYDKKMKYAVIEKGNYMCINLQ